MRIAVTAGVLFLALVARVVCAAPTARLGTDAAVRFDGDDARLQFALFDSADGRFWETLNEKAQPVDMNLSIAYRFVRKSKNVIGTGRAVMRKDAKATKVIHDIVAHTDLRCMAAGYVLKLRTGIFAGAMWKADGKDGMFPKKSEHTHCGEGTAKTFAFTFPSKQTWTLTLPKPARFAILDGRRFASDDFEIRFFCQENPHWTVGKGESFECVFASSAGGVTIASRDFHGIGEGGGWIKLAGADAPVRPESVLNFSRAPNRHTPAGADGWLTVTTNGQFRYSRKSDPVRFFGCALRPHLLQMDKKQSVEFAKELARRGYDSVRLCAADNLLLEKNAKGGFRVNPDNAMKFDQFVAAAKREGLNMIDELSGSRAWTWNEMGLVAPNGDVPPPRLCAALMLGNIRAFEMWKCCADELYGRKSKALGKPYAAEPAVALVLPGCDNGLFGAWNDLRTLPFVRNGYDEWLKSQRRKDARFMDGQVCEAQDIGVMPLHERKAAALRRYLTEAETDGFVRQRNYLASLKSKAPLGVAFGSWHYADVAKARTEEGDFTTGTLYLDPPSNLGEKWTMPCRVNNVNPLIAGSPIPPSLANHVRPDRPFCIVSWSALEPSSWRAVSGLFVGGFAAKNGWDALWRDAPPSDAMEAATDRAIWALFARGDMSEGAAAEAFVVKDGSLTIQTERTVGGFSPKADGRIVAPPMVAALSGSQAAIWATSLTSAPIANSKRILLTHLTDIKKSGTLYADSRCDLMMRRGTGATLVRAGSAKVELALVKAFSFKVYALAPDGSRLGRVESEVEGDVLKFTASVKGPKTAQYLYEIVRN